MDIKYRFYPYPVLWDRTDDYNNSGFDCKVDLQRDIRSFVLNISFELNNKKLEESAKASDAVQSNKKSDKETATSSAKDKAASKNAIVKSDKLGGRTQRIKK